jgi:hypothetical protein
MKTLLVLLLVLLAKTSVFCQTPEFTYKIDSIKTLLSVKYNVTVTVTNGNGPFSVVLSEDKQDKGFKMLDRKDSVVKDATLSFSGRKTCIIYVIDKEKKKTIKVLNY